MVNLPPNSADQGSKLVVILGPTGVGKTRCALKLAALFDGEIINGDSRQVYRGMDIGTAKPSADERLSVPHHLFDIREPDQEFNLPAFVSLASGKIAEIESRGKLPFLVGGSGQYVWGLLEGWRVPVVPPDAELRKKLQAVADGQGGEELHRRLQAVDPEAAQRIDPRNLRRVIRALEVYARGESRPSTLPRKKAPAYRVLIIGLTLARPDLYARTDARVERMFSLGWLEEVKKLKAAGCRAELSAMNSIGYQQVNAYLEGKLTLEEAKSQIKSGTHRLIRHQYAWFKARDPRIAWFDVSVDVTLELMNLLSGFLD